MKQVINPPAYSVGSSPLRLDFNSDCALRAIFSDRLMVSVFETPEHQHPLSNIWLRRYLQDGFDVTPLLFFGDSVETFQLPEGAIGWKVRSPQVEVHIALHVKNNAYFYEVALENLSDSAFKFDLVFGQDVALADEGAVKTNEAYCCQYLDHQVFKTEQAGYTVCSRQNLPQSTGNPLIQIGSLSQVASFSTDGFQFFGTDCKFTGKAQALHRARLDNQKYQYEMGYIALQTEPETLAAGASAEVTFYGLVLPHCPDANVSDPVDLAELQSIRDGFVPDWECAKPLIPQTGCYPQLLNGEALDAQEISQLFGAARYFAEERDGTLLSFFGERSQYVTLAEKERYLERPTGHVIASGNHDDFRNPKKVVINWSMGLPLPLF